KGTQVPQDLCDIAVGSSGLGIPTGVIVCFAQPLASRARFSSVMFIAGLQQKYHWDRSIKDGSLMNLGAYPALPARVRRLGQRQRAVGVACRLIMCLLPAFAVSCAAPRHAALFAFQEVMIPMRDGARLQTVILTPANQHGPLPILFRRTPY